MKKAKKKASVGERIMSNNVGRSLDDYRTSPLYPMERKLAARIDRAVRAEVRRERDRCVDLALDLDILVARQLGIGHPIAEATIKLAREICTPTP